MNRKWVFVLGGMALIASVGVTTALAIPPAPLPAGAAKDTGADDGLIQKVAGCHRSCEWGPVLRWHRHVGAACAPVGCVPIAPQPNRCWVDGWGVRHCRW